MPVRTIFAAWLIITMASMEKGYIEVEAYQGYAEIRNTGFEQFSQEIVYPVEEPPPPRHKRDTSSNNSRRRLSFRGFGVDFRVEAEYSAILAPGFRVYRRPDDGQGRLTDEGGCLYQGNIRGRPDSRVALNLCGGVSGLLQTGSEDYLIEPLTSNSTDRSALEKPHLLKKRSVAASTGGEKEQKFFCGKRRRYMPRAPRRKDHWLPGEFSVSRKEDAPLRTKRGTRRRRSVETLVVADQEMVRKHGTENVTSYLLTVFNMVSLLYQDSTIGNNVSVILVGLVLLEGDEPGLRLSHHAESSLTSFCQWQSSVHTAKGRKQHDHAVLVTGVDICAWKDGPCDTLGFAPISGMCSKYRSCTVNEDSGLALAFTVAHEIGHNFGMLHDGQGSSPCRGKRGTLMSPSLSGLDTRLLWSECSRDSLHHFLSSPRSLCLKNVPDSPGELQFPDHLPGQVYDADMQCRLQFGAKSTLCQHHPRKNEVCRALWCQRNGRECETKFLPAAEGTDCGHNKWCRKGECVNLQTSTVTDGGWGSFSDWSNCSRLCRGGIRVRKRSCDSPPPSNGGIDCKGVENEYQVCATQECDSDNPEFVDDQCSTFNKRTVKGKLYKWKPYGRDLGALSRCRIYCVPDKVHLYLVLSTKLQDGTSCSGNYSGVCIDGDCRNVGCDGKIDSNIIPDLCGVCNGDNSTCRTVKGNFSTANLKTGYHPLVTIPVSARHIQISKAGNSNSFLSLRDSGGQYFLNRDWLLDWPGRYRAGGATFTYRRWPGQPERLTAIGPTTDQLVVEVILQEEVETVIHFEFVISSQQGAQWVMRNSTCTHTCGKVCMTSENETTIDEHCSKLKPPHKKSYPCFLALCPAQWRAGEWSACVTCVQSRDVMCMQQGAEVTWDRCADVPRPIHVRKCPECTYTWHTGPWSKCRGPCYRGFRTRQVTCRSAAESGTLQSFSNCRTAVRPQHRRPYTCDNKKQNGQPEWIKGPWGQCNTECGEGESRRYVTCVHKYQNATEGNKECDWISRPKTKKACIKSNCNFTRIADCVDVYDWCPTSTNDRLCKLKFYRVNCCITCRAKL